MSLTDPGAPGRSGIRAGQERLREGRDAMLSSLQSGFAGGRGAINTGFQGGLQALNNAYGSATRTLGNYANQGRDQINQGFSGATNTLNTQFNRGMGDVRGGYDAAIGANRNFATNAAAAYNPRVNMGNQAFTNAGNLLGLNGQAAAQQAFSNFRQTPGYQFQMEQGVNALDRSASARGGINSGAAMKELNRFGQGIADQGFGQFYDRTMGIADRGYQALNDRTGLQERANAANAALLTGRGNAMGDMRTALGSGLASLQTARGTALGNSLSQQGADLASLASGRGEALAGMYGQRGNNMAQFYSQLGQNRANIYGNHASNMAQAEVASGQNRANSNAAGNSNLFGLIGGLARMF